MNNKIKVSKTEYKHTYSAEVIFDGSVYRWASNNHVPPADAIKAFGIDKLPGFDAQAHKQTRDADTDRFLADYRKSQENKVYTEEELYEMRAAFGPGATVVNAITGKKIKL